MIIRIRGPSELVVLDSTLGCLFTWESEEDNDSMRFVIRVVKNARYLICFYHACSPFHFHLFLLFLSKTGKPGGMYNVTGPDRVNPLRIGGYHIGRCYPFSTSSRWWIRHVFWLIGWLVGV